MLRGNQARDENRAFVHGNHNGLQTGFGVGQNGGHEVRSSIQGRVDEVIEHLTALTDALRSGGVQIQMGGRAIGMRVGEQMNLELHASGREGHTSRIELELSWEAPPVVPAVAPLRISSLPADPAADAPSSSAPASQPQATTDGQNGAMPHEGENSEQS